MSLWDYLKAVAKSDYRYHAVIFIFIWFAAPVFIGVYPILIDIFNNFLGVAIYAIGGLIIFWMIVMLDADEIYSTIA